MLNIQKISKRNLQLAFLFKCILTFIGYLMWLNFELSYYDTTLDKFCHNVTGNPSTLKLESLKSRCNSLFFFLVQENRTCTASLDQIRPGCNGNDGDFPLVQILETVVLPMQFTLIPKAPSYYSEVDKAPQKADKWLYWYHKECYHYLLFYHRNWNFTECYVCAFL